MFTLSTADWNTMLGMFLFPFVRILAWLAADPLMGNRTIPNTVRVSLAFALAMVIAPTLPPPPPVAVASAEALVVLLQQIAIGLALGFSLRIVFMAVEYAGQIMGLQMGLSFATLFDPVNGAQTPVISQFLTVATVLILFAFNGHHLVITALWNGFHDIPVAVAPFSGQGFYRLVEWGGAIFSMGLHLALPVTAALLAANLAIGMMTRAAPQLNIFAVGFPITLAAGFFVLYLALVYLPAFLEHAWTRALSVGAEAMRGVVGP